MDVKDKLVTVEELGEAIDRSTATVNSVTITQSGANFIEDLIGGYVKNGRLVLFTIKCKAKANVSQYISAISGFPAPSFEVRFGQYLASSGLVSDTTPKTATIQTNGNLALGGPMTSGETYVISGAYISAS